MNDNDIKLDWSMSKTDKPYNRPFNKNRGNNN